MMLIFAYLQLGMIKLITTLVTLCRHLSVLFMYQLILKKEKNPVFKGNWDICRCHISCQSQLSFQIRIAALNASSTVEDDYEGTFKSHKTQTKEAQVSNSAIFLRKFCLEGSFVL